MSSNKSWADLDVDDDGSLPELPKSWISSPSKNYTNAKKESYNKYDNNSFSVLNNGSESE